MTIHTYTAASFPAGLSDRRGTSRFPLREDVHYKVMQSSKLPPITGSGQTLNIGSGGILFTTEEKLQVGRTIEISVSWPARIDGTCPLKFVATGKIVRADIGRAAARIEKYEFKTRGAGAKSGDRFAPRLTFRPDAH